MPQVLKYQNFLHACKQTERILGIWNIKGKNLKTEIPL